MATDGNYIKSTDVDNWIAGATDAAKQAVIDRIEEQMERLSAELKQQRMDWLSLFPSLDQDILSTVKR